VTGRERAVSQAEESMDKAQEERVLLEIRVCGSENLQTMTLIPG